MTQMTSGSMQVFPCLLLTGGGLVGMVGMWVFEYMGEGVQGKSQIILKEIKVTRVFNA